MKETFKFLGMLTIIVIMLFGYLAMFGEERPQPKGLTNFEKILCAKYLVGEDTLVIIDYSTITGEYLMSDGKIYHHLIIEHTDTVGHQIYKHPVNGDATPVWYNKN